MSGKPSNPKIDGKPLSFATLASMVATNPVIRIVDGQYQRLVNGDFKDARGTPYVVKDGVISRVRKEKESSYKS